MIDGGAGCITQGDAPHSSREVPCTLWREAVAEIWLLEIRAALAVKWMSLMLTAAPLSLVKSWHPPLQQ